MGEITDRKEITCAFTNHFKDSFGKPHTSALRANWLGLYPESTADLNFLATSFSEDEIKNAVFSLGSDKAPSPDGFSILFFFRY